MDETPTEALCFAHGTRIDGCLVDDEDVNRAVRWDNVDCFGGPFALWACVTHYGERVEEIDGEPHCVFAVPAEGGGRGPEPCVAECPFDEALAEWDMIPYANEAELLAARGRCGHCVAGVWRECAEQTGPTWFRRCGGAVCVWRKDNEPDPCPELR